ncbi:MAG: hypothetical protein L0J09_07295, partial [Lactococcus lactis]|nr:hypothetical protein [Lactococcus lactis]
DFYTFFYLTSGKSHGCHVLQSTIFIENIIYWFIILPFGYCMREFTNFIGVNLIQKKHFRMEVF